MRNGKATLERMRGGFIGEYAKPKSKITYSKPDNEVGLTKWGVLVSKNTSDLEHTVYKSPVYKPYNAGPFTQKNKLLTKKIVYKGENRYFTIDKNNKLIKYSTHFEKGEKIVDSFEVMEENLSQNKNNREYLETIAKSELDYLIRSDRIDFDKPKTTEAYQINLPKFKTKGKNVIRLPSNLEEIDFSKRYDRNLSIVRQILPGVFRARKALSIVKPIIPKVPIAKAA